MHGHAQMHGRSTSTSLEKGQSLMRIYASMDPDFFITVLHVPDGPHFSKSGTAMVVPVVAGATPLYVPRFWFHQTSYHVHKLLPTQYQICIPTLPIIMVAIHSIHSSALITRAFSKFKCWWHTSLSQNRLMSSGVGTPLMPRNL